MAAYLIRRFLLMLLTLAGISIVIFTLLRVVPGNIADILFSAAGMINPEDKLEIERQLGLDQPIYLQYLHWIAGLSHGDLGYSYVSEKPALDEILPRLPISGKLAGMALCFAVLIGIPLGVISAVRQNTLLDYLLRVVSLSGLSLPSFWLGLLILMLCVRYFGWIPIYTEPPKTWWNELALFAIPAAAVGFRSSALMMRLTRSSMLEVLRQDYIRTARAKGLAERSVILKHAMRNALTPVITLGALELGTLLSGAVLTEQIFSIPGFGKLIVDAVFNRDYAVVQGVVLVTALCFIVVNLFADVLYILLNPRLRRS